MDQLLSLLSLRSKKLLTLRFIADSFGKYEQDGGRVGSRPSGVAASRAGVKGERQRVPPSLPLWNVLLVMVKGGFEEEARGSGARRVG